MATGKVTAAHKKRRRRVEFLDFMNDIVAAHPDTLIHVVLDNLKTHKPKNDRWLARHPNVRFHFTPTRASWLNQVEIWFSILEGLSLHGASFTSVKQLRQHIDNFIEAYNENAKPFVDQSQSLPEAPQTPFRASMIPGTSSIPGFPRGYRRLTPRPRLRFRHKKNASGTPEILPLPERAPTAVPNSLPILA